MSLDSLLVVFVALGLGGFVKGATGVGLPLIAVPALAAFLGVPHALAILMTPLVVTNVWQVWQHRAHRGAAGVLAPLVALASVGIGIGTWLLATLPVAALSLGLAVVITAYVALSLAKPDLALSEKRGARLAPAVGLVGGVLQGSTGISAPVTVTFLHALRLERRPFVFAVSAMFLAFALVQSAALWAAGVLTPPRLLEGAFALAPVALGMPIGAWAASKLSRKAFERAILALLVVMAARLYQTGLGW